MDPLLINFVLTLMLFGGELFCFSLFFILDFTLRQRTLVLMSSMGFLLAVVGGLFFAAAWIPFDMDACSGILTCQALIASADLIISNHQSFAMASIIGIIVGPLSLYALKRDLLGGLAGTAPSH